MDTIPDKHIEYSDLKESLHRIKNSNLNNLDDVKIGNSFKSIINALVEHRNELASAATRETGKPIKYSTLEIDRCIKIIEAGISCLAMLKFDSGILFNQSIHAQWYRRKIPVGIVVGFTPFSSPYSSLIHKFIASIIYRNRFICKPSPKALQCSMELYRLIRENCCDEIRNALIMLPFVNERDTKEFLEAADFDCLLFTGKSTTAAVIKKLIGRKKAVFETGSSAMAYIGASAEVALAVKNIVKGAFSQSGMRCVAVKNVFISKNIKNVFLDNLNLEMQKVKCGGEFDPVTDVGPIFDLDALNGLQSYIALLRKNKYQVIKGGALLNENILEPTILYDDSLKFCSVAEAFGPVLCLHDVSDLDDIPEVYYRRSSLNISIYTNNLREAHHWIAKCNHSGTIFINHGPTERVDFLPFGGLQDENEGKEGILELSSYLTADQIVFDSLLGEEY
jgi:acyl-CoA reductase-like NAD-dependent aldehyde dehydrogenase